VNAGPLDQVPVDMSSRIVAVEFELASAPNPPTMYRKFPTVVYPDRNTPAGAAFPVDQVLVAMS